MMWGIVAVIGGIILGAKAAFVVPFLYLIARKNKDAALIAYVFYAVVLMNDVPVSDFLSFKMLEGVLLGVLPAMMVLREILVGVKLDRREVFKKPEVNVALDLEVLVFIIVVVGLMAVLKLRYGYLYTPENQVSLVAGLTLIFLLRVLRKDVRQVKMFEKKSEENA